MVWCVDVGVKFSVGVGSDGCYVVVVICNNELVVFDVGKVIWCKVLFILVIVILLVVGECVFVLMVDC